MTTNSAELARLPELLKQGNETLQVVLDLLDQEQDAITAHDLSRLEHVVNEKKQALSNFAATKEQWSRLISSRAKTLEDFFDGLPGNARALLEPHWQALEAQHEAVQRANARNSQLVNARHSQVSQLVSILKGHKPSSQLYTDGGMRNNYGAQSRIGKA